ncbi:MAG: flagellar basal-body rod protein FlgB [Planctomycetota bacterium]|jgi:flagellar basal-body rod protein FlgB
MAVSGAQNNLISRMMDAAVMRHEVLSNNLANQNTPGFTRKTVDFESLLRTAVKSGKSDTRGIAPQVKEDRVTPKKEDGNNVNLELELTGIRENQLLFDTYAGIMKANFDILQTSVRTR